MKPRRTHTRAAAALSEAALLDLAREILRAIGSAPEVPPSVAIRRLASGLSPRDKDRMTVALARLEFGYPGDGAAPAAERPTSVVRRRPASRRAAEFPVRRFPRRSPPGRSSA